MAMIAIPRLKLPAWRAPGLRGLMGKKRLGLIAAAGLGLALAASGAAFLLRPHEPPAVKVSLADVLAHAPKGWAGALRPGHGKVVTAHAVIRLWDRSPAAPAHRPAAPAGPAASLTGPLPPAPIAGLFAAGPGGPLPIIAADGRTPFDAYRHPVAADSRPKVALVIRGLGLNAQATRTAIETLPAQVTLSFVVYADNLQDWIDQARAHGHEVLIEAPMEPLDYPDNDPGPYTLMARATAPETVQKLDWILSRASGYFGLTNYLGERFLGAQAPTDALAAALRGRGLAFIDDGAGRGKAAGLRRASAERVVDTALTPEAIDAQLLALEAGARVSGGELAMGSAYPVTLEKVARWAEGLEQRGLQLAPASALAIQR